MKSTDLIKYYDETYFLGGISTYTGKEIGMAGYDDFKEERICHAKRIYAEMADFRGKNVLDVGFGRGEMLKYCFENGAKSCVGIDFAPIAYKIATQYINNPSIKLYELPITDIDKIVEKDFEVVYLVDILEHVSTEEWIEFFNKLKDKLSEKFEIVAVTPSVMMGDYMDLHNNYFSKEKLEELFNKDFNISIEENWNKFNVKLTPKKMKVYYCEAMKTFGEKIKMERYNPQADIDKPVFFQGLYFDEDYEIFQNHKGKKTVFWNGSDVLRLLDSQERIHIIKQFPVTHFCHNKQLQDELASVGINAEIRPIFFGEIEDYPVSYKQSDKPQVYMTCNQYRENEYGIPQVLEVAKELPEIKFHIYGINGQNTDNVIYHGWIEEDKMDKEIKDFQGVMRLNRHDGFSQTVMKAILMGQHPIKDLAELKFLKDKKEPSNLREDFIKTLWLGLI